MVTLAAGSLRKLSSERLTVLPNEMCAASTLAMRATMPAKPDTVRSPRFTTKPNFSTGSGFASLAFASVFFPSQDNVMTVVSAACAQADMNTKTATLVEQRQSRTSVSTDSLAIEQGFG